MAEKKQMSREGYEKLEQELAYLVTVRRAEVAQKLKEARSFGDLSENAEYDEAKNEELVFVKKVKEEKKRVQSYFTDAAIEQILNDLVEEYNYTREFASKILYNGGLKIYLSMDTHIQNILDNV